MKKNVKKFTAFLIVLAFVLSGCGGGGSPSTPANNASSDGAQDHLTISVSGDPNTLDAFAPLGAEFWWEQLTIIYERLLDIDPEGNVVGCLAESWEFVDDETAMIFHLRKGVKFHNGEEMKAEDVIYSYQTCAALPNGKDYVATFDTANMEAIDEYTVRVPLNYVAGDIMSCLSNARTWIVSKKAREEDTEGFAHNPVGTGPFKLIDWVTSDRIIYERFDDYWGEAPKYKDLTIRIIPEESQAMIEAETGNVDLFKAANGTVINQAKSNPDLQIFELQPVSILYMGLNCAIEPFNNKLVRQAMATAVDREGIVNAAVMGLGVPAMSHFSPACWAYKDYTGSYPYEYDVENAKKLLAEAGYPDGFEMDLLVVSSPAMYIAVGEILQNQLGQIGITVNIKLYDSPTITDLLTGTDFDAFLRSYGSIQSEGGSNLVSITHPKNAITGGTNRAKYGYGVDNADRYAEILDEIMLTHDDDARFALYHEAQDVWLEDCPWVPIFYINRDFVAKKTLRNIEYIGFDLNTEKIYFD